MVSENNKIGLVPAILMVAGNMMGSGVFMLPANLAGIGSIAIIGWLVTVVGAIALGLVFAKLTEISTAAGGPYAYARKAFGDYMGYQTNLVYWLANVIGNVGLAVAGLGYLTPFFPALRDPLVMALGADCGYLVFYLRQYPRAENCRQDAGCYDDHRLISDNRRCLAGVVLV